MSNVAQSQIAHARFVPDQSKIEPVGVDSDYSYYHDNTFIDHLGDIYVKRYLNDGFVYYEDNDGHMYEMWLTRIDKPTSD